MVIDPVGAGATPYRTKTIRELINSDQPTIIRGNASEIMALTDDRLKTKGVDSTAAPMRRFMPRNRSVKKGNAPSASAAKWIILFLKTGW